MAIIKPFKALRPAKEKAAQVSAQPYDSSHPEISYHEFHDNPLSYFHVVKPYMDFGGRKNIEKHFPQGLAKQKQFKENGVLIKEQNHSFYIYRMIKGSKASTGLIATASVEDYLKNNILKHENTLTEKQLELAEHIQFFDSLGNPVLLTYPDNTIIDEILEKYIQHHIPEYNFISFDQVKHNLWVVNLEEDIHEIEKAFDGMNYLYIADGHHRSAGFAAYCESMRKKNSNHKGNELYNFFPVCLIPFSKLHIYEYHRLIKDEQIISHPDFLNKIKIYFDKTPCGDIPVQPLNKREFGIYFNHQAYLLKLKPEFEKTISGTLENLDVSIVEEFLLKRIFNITDSKTDKRLSFLDGSKGIGKIQQAVDNGDNSILITLYSTSIEEVKQVAEEGLIMPPKSTWIEPKLRTGMIIYETI
jgi:uncharacterized protein (DUF1015 family)